MSAKVALMAGTRALYEQDVSLAYQPTLKAARFDLEQLQGVRGGEAYAVLTNAVVDLEKNPGKGDLIDPGSGKTYWLLMTLIRDMRDMSERFPEAKWMVA